MVVWSLIREYSSTCTCTMYILWLGDISILSYYCNICTRNIMYCYYTCCTIILFAINIVISRMRRICKSSCLLTKHGGKWCRRRKRTTGSTTLETVGKTKQKSQYGNTFGFSPMKVGK